MSQISSELSPQEPWYRPDDAQADGLLREAFREIGPDHELSGNRLRAIAKCAGCDDVIFGLDDGTFAIVHLTWTGRPESPPWPSTRRLGSFTALELAADQHGH